MSTLSLSRDEVEENIYSLLPTTPFPRRPVNSSDVLEDINLEHIASLLAACAETRIWSKKPRIYSILRLAGYKGHEPVWSAFEDDDYDDYCIPFSAATVPLELGSDTDACKRFLELQPIIRTRPDFMTFDGSRAPFHRNVIHGDLHFTVTRLLSRSASSTVEVVRNRHSGLDFTRKTIPRGVTKNERMHRAREFRDEVATLRKASHHHLTECVGTYTDQTSYAMILEPAGDYSLEVMLAPTDDIVVSEVDLYRHLPEYFGCLATAVMYLHAEKIHQNDMKPESILIHHGRVFVCEFGMSVDPSAWSRASGPALRATNTYAAPETRLEGPRNEASDVWSLGRIYTDMLTALSGRSVDELDEFLDSNMSSTGRRSVGQSVIDRLTDWLEQLDPPREFLGLIELVIDMLSRKPEERPRAATVLARLKHTSPHLACHACAESEIPDLSPRSSYPRLKAEAEDHTEAGAITPTNHNGTATTDWSDTTTERSMNYRDPLSESEAFDRLLSSHSSHSKDKSMMSRSSTRSDQLTRHDSAATDTQMWQLREDEDQDFETTLLSYSIEQGEATLKCKENGIGDGALKMILYRTRCKQAWEVTRRMVIIDPDGETQTTRIFSNWLPLADLTLSLYDDTVVMSWSDCNHDVKEPTINYVETHSKKYDASKPNNKVVLKVASSATANAIALVQVLCSPLPISGPKIQQPEHQMRLMSGEKVGVFKVADEGQDDMMMIVGDLAQGATTKIYSIPSQVDLTVAMRTDRAATKQLYQAVVTGLLMTSYLSDAQNLSKMMHKRGGFHKATQIGRKAVFTFAEDKALFDFLEAVTGWSLLFLARLKSVKEKRKLTHDCGPADMLLWQRKPEVGKTQAIAMTFRRHRDGSGEKWITGRLSRNGSLHKVEGVEASVRVMCSAEGSLLERQEMRALSTKNNKASSETNGKATDAEHVSRFKLIFNNVNDLGEFQEVMARSVQDVSPKTSLTVRSGKDSDRSSKSTNGI